MLDRQNGNMEFHSKRYGCSWWSQEKEFQKLAWRDQIAKASHAPIVTAEYREGVLARMRMLNRSSYEIVVIFVGV